MLNINVRTSGIVTGDVGSIIAYEPQTYSDTIRFTYPNRPDTIKKVKYHWGVTQCSDILDSEDCVRIAIQGSGIVEMQFIMENPLTGVVVFASKPFNMIVCKSLSQPHSCYKVCSNTSDPSIVGCNYRPDMCADLCTNSSCSLPTHSCDTAYCEDRVSNIEALIEQEVRVRSESDSAIWDYLDNGESITLQSPSGKRFKVTIDEEGNLVTTLQD